MKHIKSVTKEAAPARAWAWDLWKAALNKGAYVDLLWNSDDSIEPEDIY